jgi:hypothetical protein
MPQIKKVWERDAVSELTLEKILFMRDVTSGTKHMRDVAEKKGYLPKFPSEDKDTYTARKNITVFEPFTSDAVTSSNGKIFSKPPVIKDEIPQFKTLDIIENFDRNGNDIFQFAKTLNEIQISEGIVFVYTAFPTTNQDVVSLSKTLRPYANIVRGDAIISKKYTTENGKKVLWQIVISENVNEDDGNYHQTKLQQYRKIFIDNGNVQYQVYRKDANNNEEIKESGVIKIAGQKTPQITIEPCYGVQKDYFIGISPFEELGYLNIEHFQKMSDFNMTFHLSGANTPVIEGDLINNNPAKDNAMQKDPQVGGNEVVHIEKGGSFKWVSGSSQISPMSEHIEKREARMKAMSFDVVDGGNKTATQINDEKTDKEAKLKSIALNLESCLNKTLEHMADYMNIDIADMQIEINKDFNLTVMDIADLKQYSDMVHLGDISHETLLKEAQKGERLTTVTDIQKEIELATKDL